VPVYTLKQNQMNPARGLPPMNLHKSRHETMTLGEFEDYLPDCPADEKWELIGGRVVRMMVGASHDHHRIAANLQFALTAHFRARNMDCLSYQETFRLRRADLALSALPDIAVRCGPLDNDATFMEDPLVLAEVSSKGSISRDLVEKGPLYMLLPTLQHYVIAMRHKVELHVWDRRPGGFLQRAPLTQPGGLLELTAIDFAMPVAEVYRNVFRFDAPPASA
jgi:Uma2 family endonuclease